MTIDRRDFLTTSLIAAGTALACEASAVAAPPLDPATPPPGKPRWIWVPGQLAAYRHHRRMRLAVERCTNIGYPGNFRQPLTHAWFRRQGASAAEIKARWTSPVGRTRVTIGGKGGDITRRTATIPAGAVDILVQVDFAQSLPCFLLDAGDFSSDERWEASLDGLTWQPVEASEWGDPLILPDADRDQVVTLSAQRVVVPAGPVRDVYPLETSNELLLDFQETELGDLSFAVKGSGNLIVQVGESLPEVRNTDKQWFEQVPLAPITLSPDSRQVRLPERALRYVRFTTDGKAEIAGARFHAKRWPTAPTGRFECSDSEINAVWNVAVATLRSNMHDFYLDGIKRDGLVWHDGPLTLDAYERVFFDSDLSRQTLIAETLPERPRIRDVGIIDSQMYDVIAFEQEYRARGQARFSALFRDRIEEILAFYEGLQNAAGFVDAREVKPYGFFPDWSANEKTGPDAEGAPAYGQMLLAGAFAAGGRLASAWGDRALANKYASAAQRLRDAIRKAFRDPATGLYWNGLDRTGKLDTRFTPFAQAFAIVHDIAQPHEYGPLTAFLTRRKRTPHFSLSQVVEFDALAKAGRCDGGLARLRSAWLPMIQRGYRRFFEDIDPTKSDLDQLAMYDRKYASSLCHAWAGAAPVMLLSAGVLGVRSLGPGYAECSIAPQRSGLAWARGSVPTPRGPIVIDWAGNSGTAELPPGTRAHLPGGETVVTSDRRSVRYSL